MRPDAKMTAVPDDPKLAAPPSAPLPDRYDPHQAEDTWYGVWEERGYFRADSFSKAKPYCIVIPPPNVTGSLHIGHALNNTLQDILVRWKRMEGFNALWQPGMDHAGIATQVVVERQLAAEGTTRQALGREAFVQLWEEGLIYQGEYIVNWCQRCQTVLSDLEVEYEERAAELYYIKYG